MKQTKVTSIKIKPLVEKQESLVVSGSHLGQTEYFLVYNRSFQPLGAVHYRGIALHLCLNKRRG